MPGRLYRHLAVWAPVTAIAAVLIAPLTSKTLAARGDYQAGPDPDADLVLLVIKADEWPSPPTWRELGARYDLNSPLLYASMASNGARTRDDCPTLDSRVPNKVWINLSGKATIDCSRKSADDGQ